MTLPKNFTEPDGFEWGVFKNAKGAHIRYGRLKPEGETKGTMVILKGFSECIEKYFEVARDMAARGFDVWMMDWRGQGGSERFLKDNPQRAHNEGYDEHIETLHRFTQTIVEKSGKPVFMLAHSMGAHIGLRYLKEHEGVFDSAMVTAPMMDIVMGGLPKPLVRQIVRFAKANSNFEKYVPGGGDFDESKNPFEGNKLTSDPVRFGVLNELFRDNPDLRVGDPTYGWMFHALASIDILNQEEYLKSIKTPVLMEISGDEKIVVKSAAERAADLMPQCKRVDIPEAKHEIWMERDELRALWLKAMDDFIELRLKGASLSPKKPEPHVRKPPPGPGPG